MSIFPLPYNCRDLIERIKITISSVRRKSLFADCFVFLAIIVSLVKHFIIFQLYIDAFHREEEILTSRLFVGKALSDGLMAYAKKCHSVLATVSDDKLIVILFSLLCFSSGR